MVLVRKNSDSVPMEISNVLELEGVIDFPEGLIVVFE
jgi:hypothetical protein